MAKKVLAVSLQQAFPEHRKSLILRTGRNVGKSTYLHALLAYTKFYEAFV